MTGMARCGDDDPTWTPTPRIRWQTGRPWPDFNAFQSIMTVRSAHGRLLKPQMLSFC